MLNMILIASSHETRWCISAYYNLIGQGQAPSFPLQRISRERIYSDFLLFLVALIIGRTAIHRAFSGHLNENIIKEIIKEI